MPDVSAFDLSAFQSFYPNLDFVESLTVDDVGAALGEQAIDWHSVVPADFQQSNKRATFSNCQLKVGQVIVDAICLAIGGVGLQKSIKAGTIANVVDKANTGQTLSKIEEIIQRIGSHEATAFNRAHGVVEILQTLKDGLCFDAVWEAFVGGLTWYNAAIYAISGSATILAALATGGTALVAEIVIFLADATFLVQDCFATFEACSLSAATPSTQPPPTPGAMPFAAKTALQTFTMSGSFPSYVCAVFNGGLGGYADSNPVIQTNRTDVSDWEKFMIVPLGTTPGKFALKTHSGNFVLVRQGGNVGGPNSDKFPVHTDAHSVYEWCQFAVIHHLDDTYSFRTSYGYYITAMQGGGVNANDPIFHTDSTIAGDHETLSFATA